MPSDPKNCKRRSTVKLLRYVRNDEVGRLSLQGFTLIEIIIVVAIISILAGIATPYYMDYIADSRKSVLRQNVANMRKVLDDFLGDQKHGPFRVTVTSGAAITLMSSPKTDDPTLGSELVSGAIQYHKGQDEKVDGALRRWGLKYLPKLPVFEDPETGAPINWDYGTCSAYYVDSDAPDDKFDIMNEFWFLDEDHSGRYASNTDTRPSWRSSGFAGGYSDADYDGIIYTDGVVPTTGGVVKVLDYTDISVTDSAGVSY